MKIKRQVYIKLSKDTWFVRYVDRKRGQRYSAACFYAPDISLERVKAWVSKQSSLELVPEPDDLVEN